MPPLVKIHWYNIIPGYHSHIYTGSPLHIYDKLPILFYLFIFVIGSDIPFVYYVSFNWVTYIEWIGLY